MPTGTRILVVAPDLSFRRSLAFLLETEGCRVDLSDLLPPASAFSGRYDCIVIDHRLLPPGASGAKGPVDGPPLVLLASRIEEMTARGFDRVVEKPLLGRTLVDAVRAAVREGEPPEARTT